MRTYTEHERGGYQERERDQADHPAGHERLRKIDDANLVMTGGDKDAEKCVIGAHDLLRLAVDICAPTSPRGLRDDDEAIARHYGIEIEAELARVDGDGAGTVRQIARRARKIEPGQLGEVGRGNHILDVVADSCSDV